MKTKTYLINMDRRPDRLAECKAQFEAAGITDWQRFPAVDGHAVAVPSTFVSGKGAYGCKMSHVGVLEDAIANDLDEVTVFEDDAVLVHDYQNRLADFRSKVPGDAVGWFLGGQHLHPPEYISEGVHLVRDCHRTHAYVLRREYIPKILDLFRNTSRHIDHEFGSLQMRDKPRIYSPSEWLVGQGESHSDINGKDLKERWWKPMLVKSRPEKGGLIRRQESRRRLERPTAKFPQPDQYQGERRADGIPVYSHCGDLGDTLAALAAISTRGPIHLRLYSKPGSVREPYSPEKVERIRAFFELQPYVRSVSFGEAEGFVLDGWRDHYRQGLNLSDQMAEHIGTPHPERNRPWLVVDLPNKVAPVVMHRSPRYPGRGFPWKAMVEAYRGKCVFVGSTEEHRAFSEEFGPVDFYPTATLIDLARVIAGAELFVGNQSSPYWIATGLGRRTHLEQHRGRQDNCHWLRPGLARYDGDPLFSLSEITPAAEVAVQVQAQGQRKEGCGCGKSASTRTAADQRRLQKLLANTK